MRNLLIALAISALLIFATIYFIDDPVARYVHTLPWAQSLRSPVLGLPVLVTLSAIAVVAGAIVAANGRSLSKFVETLIVASFGLTFSVCIVEFVLKRIFGRETPDEFLQNGIDAFRWFQGLPTNSFPSGHAVQIVSVGIIFLMAYPRFRTAWLSLMGLGLIALVLGNWHFVSDVIAGAAFGAVGGTAIMTLWRSKSGRIAD
jgi:membrane-associated phospholipid phosphatase